VSRVESRKAGQQAGFALILAILSLMLLTFLGLTLAATTSTELQIATNYRWSQQALYNAEAGVEAGKVLLASMNWGAVLPTARTTPWTGTGTPSVAGGGAAPRFTARSDEWGNPSRNFDGWQCDSKGAGMGYGIVLDDGTSAAPYQYKSTVFGQQLNGAFTLWIRRAINYRPDGQLDDFTTNNDNLILVSEGVAPFIGQGITSSTGAANKAVQVIEVALSRAATVALGGCGTRSGQAGGGPLGAGFDPCSFVGGGTAITNALGGRATGTGAEINAKQ
jgi:hypothetical protein